MFQRALERRLSTHIAGQPDALRIESRRHSDRPAFVSLCRWRNDEELVERFAASPMDHTGSRADVFIGKPRYFLLKEVDQPPFPLKSCQQRQRRPMHPFGRQGCSRPRRLGLVQSFDYFICELSLDENAPCHFYSVPKSNVRHRETIAGFSRSVRCERDPICNIPGLPDKCPLIRRCLRTHTYRAEGLEFDPYGSFPSSPPANFAQKCKFQIVFSMSHTGSRYTRISSMKFRLSIGVAVAVFAAAMFASPALAQMLRVDISGRIAQARISSGFGVGRGIPRTIIGFGHINRSQFFPASFLYPPYFYPPYFSSPYFYPDYDYQEYEPNEMQASPPQVITVQPPPAPAPPPAATPVESLVLENHGGQWVRVSNLGQPSGLAQSTGLDTARAATPTRLPPTVLVFCDGHTEEVERYMIQGDVIFTGSNYWTTGSWTKKVPIPALDIPATVKLNEERGVKFSLPSGPNEVMIRP